MARSAHNSANRSPPLILLSPKLFFPKGVEFYQVSSEEAPRTSSGKRLESAPADLGDRALAGDLAILRRARVARGGPPSVVIDERARLRPVDLEPLLHRFLFVVVAL